MKRLRDDRPNPLAAFPGSGSDTLIGKGMAEALKGAQLVLVLAGMNVDVRDVTDNIHALISRTRLRVRRRSEPKVALPDAAIHPIEHTRSAADPLALDPLSPIAPPPGDRWFRPAH